MNLMNDSYDFVNNLHTDVRALIPMIATHGENLVGAEIGVWKADSFLTLLQNCPNIKTLHGVDCYEPYDDYLIPNEYKAPEPGVVYDRKAIEWVKMACYHRLEYSGHRDKIRFHEMDSNEAADYIDDESLDFIFLDAYLTGEQVENDLKVWYPKVKYNGIFSGHDWNSKDVEVAVNDFRRDNNITKIMCTYDNTWVWMK
tara:strand:- start:208 stop:804 length:597 start_codon:yes stop_codon:yes gene_type:complete